MRTDGALDRRAKNCASAKRYRTKKKHLAAEREMELQQLREEVPVLRTRVDTLLKENHDLKLQVQHLSDLLGSVACRPPLPPMM